MNRVHGIILECRIAKRLIQDALALGYSISVNDGEVTTLKRSTDPKAIWDAMFSTDEDYILLHQQGYEGGPNEDMRDQYGWVRLIYGNEEDLISDYNTRLDPLIAPIYQRIETYSKAYESYDAAKAAGLLAFDAIQPV